MIFLIQYDRQKGKLNDLRSFEDEQKESAEAIRFRLELDLNRQGADVEVLLLEAASEADVRKTHRRYFEDLNQIAKSGLAP